MKYEIILQKIQIKKHLSLFIQILEGSIMYNNSIHPTFTTLLLF